MNRDIEDLAKRHLQLCQFHARETDALQRTQWEVKLKGVEKQLRESPRSEATIALMAVVGPFVAQTTGSSTDSAAVLRTWHFLESLYRPQLTPVFQREPEPLPEDLEGLIHVMRDLRESRRRQAMTNILSYGPAAVSELELALSRHSSPLVQARLLYLLAMLGEVRLMPAVWRAYQETSTGEASDLLVQSLLRMGQTLESSPQKLPLPVLIDLFSVSRSLMPQLADSLARTLTRLTKTAPTLELRAILPYLQGSWLRPLSATQREMRAAIEEVTRNLAELPLPANAPVSTQTLPRPAEPNAVPENLPLPAVESSDAG